ncbi:MAG: hypothetical protein HC925_08785 [Coleofasciculaceae cyanobacterium SM2_3_26]|nr:hypothetical protein [Coleofasciculaceae cyanobacterium SM2_3_26]
MSGFEAIVDPSIPQLQLSTPTSTPRGIPLYGRMGVMTARVMVNDRGPYLFVLDTGAEWSVMSERLAARLSLSDPTTTQEVEVLGFCGTERGKQIHLNSLSIEGTRCGTWKP